MTETNRALVQSVTEHYTVRREYAARTITGRVEVLEFLLDNMDATSALAQRVGLIQYRATRDAQGRFVADDRAGAAGFIKVAGQQPGKRVLYIEGRQHGLFNVRGRGVAVIDYRAGAGGTLIYEGAVFVKVDNAVLAALAQMFFVFVRGTVDRHFQHVIRQPVLLTKRAAAEPDKLREAIAGMAESDREMLAPLVGRLNGGEKFGAGQL